MNETNVILLPVESVPFFTAAVEALAKRGIVIKYSSTSSNGGRHFEIDLGDSWAAIIFDLGYEFHKAQQ